MLLLLNILPTCNPPKSKMLPPTRGAGYGHPCVELLTAGCAQALHTGSSDAADRGCLHPRTNVLPLQKLLQILEALLPLIFEFLKYWCLGQKSAPNSNCTRTAVPWPASTITTERESQVDLKSKTGTKSSFWTARSETNDVQGTVSYQRKGTVRITEKNPKKPKSSKKLKKEVAPD